MRAAFGLDFFAGLHRAAEFETHCLFSPILNPIDAPPKAVAVWSRVFGAGYFRRHFVEIPFCAHVLWLV